MNVNYIDIVLIAVLLLSAVLGYFRGFIINIVNLFRWIIGMFLCFFFGRNLPQPLYESFIEDYALARINEKIVTTGNIGETIDNLNKTVSSLPPFIKEYIDIERLNISTDDIAQSILTNVFEPVIIALLKIIVFLLVFVIFFGATGIIINIIRKSGKKREEKRGHKSLAKKTDRLLGLAFGAVKALIIVFAISSVLLYISDFGNNTGQQGAFFTQLEESRVLSLFSSIHLFKQ